MDRSCEEENTNCWAIRTLKNKPNKWTHGFAVVHFFPNGDFDVDLKRIVRGRFVYNGKLYDGNK